MANATDNLAFRDRDAEKMRVVALLVMAGINVIWGAAFPLTKVALETIPPMTFALLRFVLAMALLLPLAGAATWQLLRGPDRRRIIVMGLAGFCIAQVAQTAALRLSPATDIAMIATMSPLWVALLAWPFLNERLSGRAGAGFLVAIAGLLLIIWPHEFGTADAQARLLGDLIFLVNSVGWAVYNLMGREMMRRHDPLPTTAAAGLVGTLALVPFAAFEWLSGERPVFTPIGVTAIAYTGILVTVVGFVALFWALARVRAAQVAVMMYLQPLAGVLLAWLWLGEQPGGVFLAGSALVLLGVTLVTLPRTFGQRNENG